MSVCASTRYDEGLVVFPIKLNDSYPCQGRDHHGEYVTFNDILREGDVVATFTDCEGNSYGPYGVVVRRENGLWIEA
jgi:hypothetical protein